MLQSLKQELLPPPMVDLLPPPPPPVAVSLTSVIKREPPPIPQPAHLQKTMMNTHQSLPLHLQMTLHPPTSNGGNHYHDAVQNGPIDMTVSSASAPVSVIVPRIPLPLYNRPTSNNSVEGVLDLSNSRSDSEAEPIEEEVDEEDDCIDEGLDSDSEEEEHLRMIAAWKRENNHLVQHYSHYAEDLTSRANGDQRYVESAREVERYSESNNREDRHYSDGNREDRHYSEGNRDDHHYSDGNREDHHYSDGNREDHHYSDGNREDHHYSDEGRDDPYCGANSYSED